MPHEEMSTPQDTGEPRLHIEPAGINRASEHRDDFEKRTASLIADVEEAQLQIRALRERQAVEQSLMKNLKGAEGINKAREAEELTLREIAKWERKIIDTMGIIETEKRSLLN